MGRDKAWLTLDADDDAEDRPDGEALLQRVCRIAAEACPQVIVVARRGVELPPLPAGTHRVDDDDDAPVGPLAGAAVGLRCAAALGAELAYVGGCDAAWLTRAHVEAMLSTLERSPDATAAVPVGERRVDGSRILHATSGAVRVTAACELAAQLLAAGERALRRLYERLASVHVDADALPDPEAIRGCNTPQEWELARAHWMARP